MDEIHGKVWWSELMTRDVAGAVAYYSDLMGWRVDEVPMGEGVTYHVCSRDDVPVAGIMDMTGSGEMAALPPHWFTYLAVDDVDEAVAATLAAGGALLRPVFEVPQTGRIAIVTDPTGAALGLMTPEPMPTG